MDPTHLVPAWSAPTERIRPLHGINNGPLVAQHGAATHDLTLDLTGLPWSGPTQAEWQLLGDQGPRLSATVPADGRTPTLQLPQPSTGFLQLRPA